MAGFATQARAQKAIELSDEQVENIVRRSYPYVALYNVNHKIALDTNAPINTGGWNKSIALTTLARHTTLKQRRRSTGSEDIVKVQ